MVVGPCCIRRLSIDEDGFRSTSSHDPQERYYVSSIKKKKSPEHYSLRTNLFGHLYELWDQWAMKSSALAKMKYPATKIGKKMRGRWYRYLTFRGIMLLIRIKMEINKRVKANQPSHEMWMERIRENPLKEAAVEVFLITRQYR